MKGEDTNVTRSGDSAYNKNASVMEFNNKLDVEYNLPITSNRNAKWWVALSIAFRCCR